MGSCLHSNTALLGLVDLELSVPMLYTRVWKSHYRINVDQIRPKNCGHLYYM